MRSFLMPIGLGAEVAAGGGGTPLYEFTLSASEDEWDLNAELITAGWDEIEIIDVTIVVEAGVQIGSTSTSTPGMDLGTLPVGSTIALTIDSTGEINGKGGAGGSTQSAGSVGGEALYTRTATTLTNNGEINSGGGGGGGGATDSVENDGCNGTKTGTGGAGGNGYGNGAAASGSSGGSQSGSCLTHVGGPDEPPCNSNQGSYGATGGTGGTGGDKGTAGSAGAGGSATTRAACAQVLNGSGGSGGAAGDAVDGDSYVTYDVTGTINGGQVN